MTPTALVVPGSLQARTGGYIYDRHMVDGLRRLGRRVDVLELDSSFPRPTPAALEDADRTFAAIPAGTITIVDSLALGALAEIITREAARLPIVALVHLPLAAVFGLDRASAEQFEAGERCALAAAALVVVTGRAALPLIDRYTVASSRIVIVEPGTDRAPLVRVKADTTAHGSPPRPLELLTVGTLHPGKGHELLLEALSTVRHPAWRLTCAGSLTRDPETAMRVRVLAAQLGLKDRVSFVGDLDRDALAALYGRADVAVFATQQETYGMAVAEALAHGLPIVATMTGAIADLVGNEAGLLVPVGDRNALATALARVIGDASLRARLAEGAGRRRDQLPTWDAAARLMSAALDRLCERTNGVGVLEK
jgi:glycosyltransferase involved in cell wall biosynthesis